MGEGYQWLAELASGETVETVSPVPSAPHTPLKRGVNENRHPIRRILSCTRLQAGLSIFMVSVPKRGFNRGRQ
jgi:hypothetical protein